MPPVCLTWVFVALVASPQQSTQPASLPQIPASQRAAVRDVRQLDIYRKLLRERDAEQPLLPTAEHPTDSTESAVGGLLIEGTMLVQKSGRLIREADRSLFEFDALGVRGAPSTIELVRNGLLETAESAAERGTDQFTVTAEVTRYRGRNYLILKQVSAKLSNRNLGQ